MEGVLDLGQASRPGTPDAEPFFCRAAVLNPSRFVGPGTAPGLWPGASAVPSKKGGACGPVGASLIWRGPDRDRQRRSPEGPALIFLNNQSLPSKGARTGFEPITRKRGSND